MCLAIPSQIIELNGDFAKVTLQESCFQVDISFLDNPQIGDWVIVHAGVALSIVDESELKEIQQLVEESLDEL
ncbi:MAG: HypC/HybG/HupF family hydrogenase formation chaperone [Bacteriovoracaceae bacterium]|nr:HypC/HybG/HupF family hydrogenase formation chaperone [Bacteriovoracaceae bacterium]